MAFYQLKELSPYIKYITTNVSRFPFSNSLAAYLPEYLGKYLFKAWLRPVMIICETVAICNNDCIMCSYGRYGKNNVRRSVMSLEMFEKVLRDYSEMGGGKLSLTPHPGEIFLDDLLLERINIVKNFPKISSLSVTTNAVPASKYNDSDLEFIVSSFERIHISIYGLDQEECYSITNRDCYQQMVRSIKRIIEADGNSNSLLFGFRFLKQHSDAEVSDWIFQNFGRNIPYGYTNTYNRWSKAIETNAALPFDASWLEPKDNSSQCLRPLVALQVYSNGDVSFCPCADYYDNDDLYLGTIHTRSLMEIYNSKKALRLWEFEKTMPAFCKSCSIHIPPSEFENNKCLFENPLDFLGG